MKDLKQRTIRGGAAKICSQAANFLVRMGSLMILARLLDPKDFGLVGMVTAVIGVFSVFRDFGLSAAAVQRTTVTEEQSSTLFWINLLVGAILGLLALAVSPFIAAFYHERRLFGITAVLAAAFLFNAAGVQHTSLLERQMRFTTLSIIDLSSLLASTAIGIGMAMRGLGYWALVATTAITPLVYTACVWLTTAWVPGRPRRQAGVRSMMRFGGTLTLNGLVMYIASNFEKVLLGRFWGVDALGLYGRAYQLINIPTDNLNSAAGGVAFAALSRLQGEPSRLRSYFLKGYSLVLSLTVPITFTCSLFADDMILVFLGPKWKSAAVVFRLLAPTTLAFAILNPLGWLMNSLGLVGRGLKIALVLGPVMIAGYLVGLPYGPKGVAFAYSAVMMLCVIPLITWATHGTVISVRDILLTVSRPFLSGGIATGFVLGLQYFYSPFLPPLPRLAMGVALFFTAYLAMLLFVMRQKLFYVALLRGLFGRQSDEEGAAVLV
ncbi:MAG TPA: lipopolysaccharide biosynthesis protein [Candidatus Dormibacteraeota bacterium]|nr:lipopolysaccharide biosynthesis protein [Candidatus Dormibacteraeota bacterium]